LSIDPLAAKYPFYSPYAFSGNRVIDMVELEGLEPTKPPSADAEEQEAPVQSGPNKGQNFNWVGFDGKWQSASAPVIVKPSENQNPGSWLLGPSGGYTMESDYGEGKADRLGDPSDTWDVTAIHVLAGKEGAPPEGDFFEKMAEAVNHFFEGLNEGGVTHPKEAADERQMMPRRENAQSVDKPVLHQPTDDSINVLIARDFETPQFKGSSLKNYGVEQVTIRVLPKDTSGGVIDGNRHERVLQVQPQAIP
jgi:hypothetical protein